MQAAVHENSANVVSINDLTGILLKNSKVKTLKKQNHYDLVNLYNHNISAGDYLPSSGVFECFN